MAEFILTRSDTGESIIITDDGGPSGSYQGGNIYGSDSFMVDFIQPIEYDSNFSSWYGSIYIIDSEGIEQVEQIATLGGSASEPVGTFFPADGGSGFPNFVVTASEAGTSEPPTTDPPTTDPPTTGTGTTGTGTTGTTVSPTTTGTTSTTTGTTGTTIPPTTGTGTTGTGTTGTGTTSQDGYPETGSMLVALCTHLCACPDRTLDIPNPSIAEDYKDYYNYITANIANNSNNIAQDCECSYNELPKGTYTICCPDASWVDESKLSVYPVACFCEDIGGAHGCNCSGDCHTVIACARYPITYPDDPTPLNLATIPGLSLDISPGEGEIALPLSGNIDKPSTTSSTTTTLAPEPEPGVDIVQEDTPSLCTEDTCKTLGFK